MPREALDAVRDAVFAAGAGRIGGYERCSWYAEGTGTFLGGADTKPGGRGARGGGARGRSFASRPLFPEERHAEVVAALRASHPYEEPAFDVYHLIASV